MDPTQLFNKKAGHYARYRWDYDPAAIQAVFSKAGLNDQSVVADIGAGTGILTRNFVGKVGQVFAIEPNAEMRTELERELSGKPGCDVLGTRAEATGLPASSLDAIVVGQAIHWFDPPPTRQEFSRVLKPGGWLVMFGNHPEYESDEAVEAMRALLSEENGVIFATAPGRTITGSLSDFYYGPTGYEQLRFSFQYKNDWQHFLGSLQSTSAVPTEDHPLYPRFAAAARDYFERFQKEGFLSGTGVTEVWIGQPQIGSSGP